MIPAKINKIPKEQLNIEEVKRQNKHSGLTYNQVKQLLSRHYLEQKTEK